MDTHRTPDSAPLTNRREFLRNTAAVGAGLSALAHAPALRAADGAANDKIVIGVMGMGRGSALANGFAALPGATVKYVCDVDEALAGRAADAVAEIQKTRPEAVKDFRRILDDKDVAALAIAAPDHWHAPAAILACSAGKHVYVEKPCTHNPHEGELLLQAARQHKRVVQHGTQRRSWEKVVEAVEKTRAGEIGKVRFVRGWYTNRREETGRRTEAPVPPGLDWDLWQGPASRRPYTANVHPYKWHWFWHWGTGELGNNGIHALDICRWGLGVDYPVRVTAGGGRYFYADEQETPDTMNVTFDFGKDKGCIVWEGRSCLPYGLEGSSFGIGFYGDNGTIVSDGNGYKQFDANGKQTADVSGSGADAPHLQNFLAAIRGEAKLVAEIEEGVKSVLLCHIGNIAYRTGRTVNCDGATGKIVGDPEAEALWGREYEKGWEPKV